jgi:hypothetical protein
MANEYKIKLTVRGRTSEFGADSVNELLLLMATELFTMDRPQTSDSDNADEAAKKLIERYYQRFVRMNNHLRSPIASAGLEVEVAKCYLAGTTTENAVTYLQKERNFKTSKTAIGRYFARFAPLLAASKTA